MTTDFFITGTDTGVGKTHVAAMLLRAAALSGFRALALKPVAAGAQAGKNHRLENEDALALAAAANCHQTYDQVNPFCFEDALSPHIAAINAGADIALADLVAACKTTLNISHDFGVIEGAGGWRVPINGTETMADLAQKLGFPVVLVVGMRLGCLNHALLTAEAVLADGLNLRGWVANELTPDMAAFEENVTTLQVRLPCPLLARIPHGGAFSDTELQSVIDISKFVEAS